MSPEQAPKLNKSPSGVSETKISTGENKLSPRQVVAIKFSAKIGKQIQEEFPEIAMDYVNGLSGAELTRKYDIQNKFGFDSAETARTSVINALRGYSGNFHDPYPGLIKDPKMLQFIGEEHKKDSSKKVGERMRDEGLGMFGMTPEEKRQVGSRAGMVLFQTGKGIHAHTTEERSEVGKMGVIARGFVPLSTEVTTFIRGLNLTRPEYLTTRQQVNAKKIAAEVNEKFYGGKNVVSADTISLFIWRTKKRDSSTK